MQKDFREPEKTRDTLARKRARAQVEYRQNEKKRESALRYHKRQNTKPSNVLGWINNFHQKIAEGPLYICTSCNQLMYKHSVGCVPTSKEDKVLHILQQCPKVQSVEQKVWMCRTCKSHIAKGKIPPLSVINGMTFPESTPVLKQLNPLELTLLAVRLPFMKIHQAPRGRQKKLCGNMVLVPADVDTTVTQLPRLPSQAATIRATLKRRLVYKHHVYSLNIRPEMPRDAATSCKVPHYIKDISVSIKLGI